LPTRTILAERGFVSRLQPFRRVDLIVEAALPVVLDEAQVTLA
jgi:hypothetical protein